MRVRVPPSALETKGVRVASLFSLAPGGAVVKMLYTFEAAVLSSALVNPDTEVDSGTMNAFIESNAGLLLPVALLLALAAAVTATVLAAQVRRMRKPFGEMAKLHGEIGTEESLRLLLKGVDENREFIRGHGEDLKLILGRLERCFKGIGMVKYNAFEDIGGNQSYSICILTGEKNGFMLTNLVGRNSTRGYAIEVRGGKAERELGSEESQALAQALKSLEN